MLNIRLIDHKTNLSSLEIKVHSLEPTSSTHCVSAVVAYFNTQYVNMINIPDARETTGAGDQNDDSADPLATQKSSVPFQLLFTLSYILIRQFCKCYKIQTNLCACMKSEIHPFTNMEILTILRNCLSRGYLVTEG